MEGTNVETNAAPVSCGVMLCSAGLRLICVKRIRPPRKVKSVTTMLVPLSVSLCLPLPEENSLNPKRVKGRTGK